ncbi:hypothetical protein BH09MYX1_BH09MYX1_47000 [soil metagenome]
MSDHYHHAHDLGRFCGIGEQRPELAKKLFDGYEAVHVAAAILGGAWLAHGIQMRNVAKKVGM